MSQKSITSLEAHRLIAIFGIFTPTSRRDKYIADLRTKSSGTYQKKAMQDCVAGIGVEKAVWLVLVSYYIEKYKIWGFRILDTPKKLANGHELFEHELLKQFEKDKSEVKTKLRQVFQLVKRDMPIALPTLGFNNIYEPDTRNAPK